MRQAMRALALSLILALPSAAHAAEPAEEAEEDRKLDPEDGFPKPDPEDLRAGHLLLSASGGVWVPSNRFTPQISNLGNFAAAGSAHLHLGVGLNRYLVLGAAGGYSRLLGADDACGGCVANSFDAGLSLAFFLTQGFAFEPWASYGIGYRHTAIDLGPADDPAPFHALEVARLAIGGSYFPLASFGFGPFLETDLGFRDFDDPAFYAAFSAGLRLTFDPLRSGTEVQPQIGSR